MRLKAIKLAGFKSFVDPTRINFPSNMCAIVGPNGCGKSNIIDAVRWVMGESSAKNLRGESMTDVIFNGSRGRGPVGQASVELIFDNSDQRLTGAYAAYAEISVKRRVTRESKSHYFLNGTVCRRRDVLDIFLGTGLGPRSYAIISQGIVSNLIESKPEELRVFIEEAAGISKYKERRRETGNRIRRTQENLERLTDLREELALQIERLSKQAKAAEQYQGYKTQEHEKKAQLMALRWRSVNEGRQQRAERIATIEIDHERHRSEQRQLEAHIEQVREAQAVAGEHLQSVQAQFYSLGGEISRIEQSIAHQRDRDRQIQSDLAQIEQALAEGLELLEADQEQLERLDEELLRLEPEIETAQLDETQNAENLLSADDAMHRWQERWAQFNAQQAVPSQQVEVLRVRLQQLEQQQLQSRARQQRLEAERSGFDPEAQRQTLESLQQAYQEGLLRLDALQQEKVSQQAVLEQTQEKQRQSQQQYQQIQREVSELSGRHASLQALQQAGSDAQARQKNTLQQRGLAGAAQLFELLQVEPGWEAATELVFGPGLHALCVDTFEPLKSDPLQLDGLGFYHASEQGPPVEGTLATKVQSHFIPCGLLDSVLIAESRAIAFAMQPTLKPLQSVITRCGCWLGRDWLVFASAHTVEEGLLARQHQLVALENELAEREQEACALQQALLDQQALQQRLQLELRAVEAPFEQQHQDNLALQLQLGSLQTAHALQQRRLEQLQQEITEQSEQAFNDRETQAHLSLELEEALEAVSVFELQRETLLNERDQSRAVLDQQRQSVRQQRDRLHQLQLRQQTLTTQRQSSMQGVERLHRQQNQANSRRAELQAQRTMQTEPEAALRLELDELLEKRLRLDEQLQNAREVQNTHASALEKSEQQRSQIQALVEQLRTQLEAQRLDHQGEQVMLEALEAQVIEAQFDLPEVLATLSATANEDQWEEELAALARRIQRLGAINLAAIEEFELQQQRKHYLDRQNDDLIEALDTLESAIRRIDRETRSRFKTTFDQINQGLQTLFPRVFGGGRAYLQMTGDDLLDTGVTIMAQPPGKKNSTIHLLSGGEKALTAIALVFSIFQLNPAPFCLLDEVDAPLDDANVGRYANMVKEMSEQVQFVYITHNKIAMEAANQLIGVTMQEPGVSRPVTVDIEQATELAEC